MEQDNHNLIDLETLGLKQDAAIISIGVAKFNIETGKIQKIFHGNIKWDSALKYGNAEPSTVAWWQQQTGTAKEALATPAQEDSEQIMKSFVSFLGIDPIVWGNGACFDLGKLEHWFEKNSQPHPWFYRNTRDVRTMDQLGRDILNFGISDQEFIGTKHHPVDDAVNTARYVSQVYRSLLERQES